MSGWHPIDDPEPAPLLLTAECAAFAAKLEDIPSFLQIRLQALADRRTACVRVLTEDECRAEFIKWARGAFTKGECACDPQGVFFNPDVSERWGAWLACARAMGAIR